MSNEKKRKKAKVNPELDGLNVEIDTFGEIKFNYNIDKINDFLDKTVDDKKLRNKPSKNDESEEESDYKD
ncbi:hypothetical protein BKI52_02460 [marine bacterium AO1-C]|nr:hypothetical protein BKI52_02460 [marine bacterium AO1-C]